MKLYKPTFTLILILLTFSCVSQKGYTYNNRCYPGDTLFDKSLKIKVIIDSTHRCVVALDMNNKVLWRTNPWTLGDFRSYDSSINNSFRSNRISAFFLLSKKEKADPYIYLRFLNSPTGAVIERKSGRFHLLGVM